MRLVDILKNKDSIFIIDDIEDKKTRELVKDINNSLVKIVVEHEEFNAFAASQLNGEYHKKIVNVKSLLHYYDKWNGIKTAYSIYQKEEENKINKLYANKAALINKLKTLQGDCHKSLPVVSAYHLSNGELVPSNPGHVTIIFGRHNNNIIEEVITQLESDILVEGNFEKVNAMELKANYSVVESNANIANEKAQELFASKPAKLDKLLMVLNAMIESAKALVFFETYKPVMLELGCPSKDVELLEKELIKKYVPFKKQLQKILKFKFEDISSIVIDENEYQSDDKTLDELDDLDIISGKEEPAKESAFLVKEQPEIAYDMFEMLDDDMFKDIEDNEKGTN